MDTNGDGASRAVESATVQVANVVHGTVQVVAMVTYAQAAEWIERLTGACAESVRPDLAAGVTFECAGVRFAPICQVVKL
jgi:hypothetical protein